MASKDKDNVHKELKVGSNLSAESVRVICESVGISSVSDEAAAFLADQITYHLKSTVQDAQKFMRHSKRCKLSCTDFDMALQSKKIEPIYGSEAKDAIPFRFTSGGGRELHFNEEKEMDLPDLINSSLPKLPLDISLKAHWLSMEGVQPAIPENPPAASKEIQKKEMLDTNVKNMIAKGHKNKKHNPGSVSRTGVKRKYSTDMMHLKELTPHELSVEQQYFYKEVTEACVGPEETKRSEALISLSSDPGLFQMMPRFAQFLSVGVRTNVAQNNLALLIYLMRMVKAILDNPSLYLEKYLHDLVPTVMTCVVSHQLCHRPDTDNHWALRDFAARLVATMCKNFSTNTNNIQNRVTHIFVTSLQGGIGRKSLAAQYGALAGLGELGPEVVKTCVMPHLRSLGEDIQAATEGHFATQIDKISCENLRKQIGKYLPAVLKTSGVAETQEEYINAYGYLGPLLLSYVKERQVSILSGTATTRPTLQIHQPGRAPQQILIQQPGSASTPMTPTATAFFPSGSGQTPRTPSAVSSAGGGQKIVLVSSQPARSVTGSVSDLSSVTGTAMSSSGPTIVKLVSASSAPGTVTAGAVQTATSGQKIVVIQGSTIKQETLQTSAGTPATSVVTTSAVPSVAVSTSQDIGVKSIFPTQTTSIISVKKEEKP